MLPKDKYTTFNPTSAGYRKSVHRVPKFTKVCLLRVAKGEDRMLIDVAVDPAREPYRFLSLDVDNTQYPPHSATVSVSKCSTVPLPSCCIITIRSI